jgi:DNA-directed RNA polymerase subunit RPC12/RpoP
MVKYQCSHCQTFLSQPAGRCPECGYHLFLKHPVKPPAGKPAQMKPCSNCGINMGLDDFSCENCGHLHKKNIISSVGLTGFFSIMLLAVFILMLWTKTQGNQTATFPIVFLCGFGNLLLLGGLGFFLLKWRRAVLMQKRILLEMEEFPSVELVEVITEDVKQKQELFQSMFKSCKAYTDGKCVVMGRDTGPCTWNPSNWQSCGVVTENRKFNRWFDEP